MSLPETLRYAEFPAVTNSASSPGTARHGGPKETAVGTLVKLSQSDSLTKNFPSDNWEMRVTDGFQQNSLLHRTLGTTYIFLFFVITYFARAKYARLSASVSSATGIQCSMKAIQRTWGTTTAFQKVWHGAVSTISLHIIASVCLVARQQFGPERTICHCIESVTCQYRSMKQRR